MAISHDCNGPGKDRRNPWVEPRDAQSGGFPSDPRLAGAPSPEEPPMAPTPHRPVRSRARAAAPGRASVSGAPVPGPYRPARRLGPRGHHGRSREHRLRRVAGRWRDRPGQPSVGRRQPAGGRCAGPGHRRRRLRARPAPDLGGRRRDERGPRLRRAERRAAPDLPPHDRVPQRRRRHPARGLRDRLEPPAAHRRAARPPWTAARPVGGLRAAAHRRHPVRGRVQRERDRGSHAAG